MTKIGLNPDLLRTYFALSDESPTNLIWVVARPYKIQPGDKAGCLNGEGYYQLRLNYRSYLVHRIVWALANDRDPGRLQIDHIDMNRSNNTPSNLRLVTHRVNNQLKSNASPLGTGVAKCGPKFQARIRKDGKLIHLGTFTTQAEASNAYQRAAVSIDQQLPHWALPVPGVEGADG